MTVFKITDYTAQTAAGLAVADLVETVDVSDTSMDATGTNKKLTVADLISAQRQLLTNASTAAQGAGFATDTYLTGSNVAIPSGYPVVGTTYRLVFSMAKTAAGTATPIITVRFGTAGTTADTSRCSFTFGAGTAATDTALVDVLCVFRSVGSGTSAVIQGVSSIRNILASTGFTTVLKTVQTTGGGFDSTVASSIIGTSYNGGTSAAHTVQLVRAELIL